MPVDLMKLTNDALGDPLAKYRYKPPPKAHPVEVPSYVPREDFMDIIRASILIYEMTDGDSDQCQSFKSLRNQIPKHISNETLTRTLESPGYKQALILRGVLSPVDAPLTGEQLRALSVLTNLTSHASLEARLKRAGIESWKWQTWMQNTIFRAAHDKIAHEMFTKASAAVDTQLVSGALSGKLDFIKYYHEITGRNDPSAKNRASIQKVIDDFVDLILRHVSDPDKLREMSAEISMIVSKLG